MLFYSFERNYPLFVIKYLVSLGAGDNLFFYRPPPFEICQNALDKAIEMKRTDIIKYLKKIGFSHEYDYSEENKDSNIVEEKSLKGFININNIKIYIFIIYFIQG